MNWLELLQPVLLAIVAFALSVGAAYLKKKFDIDLEKTDREALHSAIESGVKSAISKEKSVKEATFDAIEPVKQIVVREAIEYAKNSVPDALRRLNPTAGILGDLALSKLEQFVQMKR